MTTAEKKNPALEAAPHLAEGSRTAGMMWTVSLCLLPAAVWGVAVFGLSALVTLLTAIVSALLAELFVNALRKKVTLGDGSAFLTGLIIGLCLPPAVPIYVPIIASVFAMAIVKHAFGGLGANWMNPAMAGLVFVLLCFPAAGGGWLRPVTLPAGPTDNALTAAPLGLVKNALAEAAVQSGTAVPAPVTGGPLTILAGLNYPVTAFDSQLTAWLNGLFGGHIPKGCFDLFVGNSAGAIGEVSIVLLLLGAAVLFIRKIVTWEIPVALIGSFTLLAWVFGGLPYGGGLFQGDFVFQLLSGGLVLAAFYVATDPVSAPLLRTGKLIFGLGVGALTFLIRTLGVWSEGVAVAIIVMNMFVPLLDQALRRKPAAARLEKEI